MANISFVGGTIDNLTIDAAQMSNAHANLYRKSPTYKRMVDYILRHESNPDILVIVEDTVYGNNGSDVNTPSVWVNDDDETITPGQWPYPDFEYAIRIDPAGLDGDKYAGTDITRSFERTLAHEMTHIYQDLMGEDPFDEENEEEIEQEAVDAEDRVGEEALGEPPNGRGEPGPLEPGEGGEPEIRNPDDEGNPLPSQPTNGPIAQLIDDIIQRWIDAWNEASPLVLHLSDNDAIDLISLANSETWWDIDQDGFAESSGWATADDGLLAIDLNENGRIDDNGELFGTVDTDGFTILAEYDSNEDGEITEQDAVWGSLIVWQDDNENGYSEASELHALVDFDIVSIDLDATEVSQTNQGHSVTHTSTFTVDDGVNPPDARIVHDVWFEYDNVNTVYVGDYDLDFDVLMMGVDQRGYGTLPDLHIAMSLDNDDQDPDGLFSLITALHNLSFTNLFDETTDVLDDVRDIMYRWAGVDDVAALSRGPNVDARQLEFLEKMMGEPFFQTGSAGQRDPGPDAAADLEEAFHIMLNHTYARLLTQSAGGELFTGDFYYDSAADSFEGITGLDSTALSSLETEATGLANTAEREVFWQNVVRMIEFSVGTTNLPGADQTALDDAINDSDASLDLAGILADLDYVAPTGTTYNGTSGNDSLTTDTSDNDELNGLAGDDTITASAGNDTLDGGADDDTLTGGADNDYLLGDLGEDEYHYDPEDGYDVMRERGTGTGNDNDRIVFGPGIDSGDLTITRITNQGLLIEIDNGVDDPGEILIEYQFNYAAGGGHVEWIDFDADTSIELATLNHTLTGTQWADELWGSRFGSGGSDTIYGGDGNDEIHGNAPNETDTQENWVYGEGGNDELYGGGGVDHLYGGDGDDDLDGGAGNDELDGGAGDDIYSDSVGDDTYVYLSGHDVITDTAGTNGIVLDAVWDSVTPQYFKIGNDLQIYWDADNTITVISHFTTGEMSEMVYDDTTTVDLTTISPQVQGTSGDDNPLDGTNGDDTIFGFAGNDNTQGDDGNDSLYGGTGDDLLYGENGNDYIDGGAGDDHMEGDGGDDHFFYVSGHDIVDELSGTDVLELAEGWTWEDLSFARYDANDRDLVIEINGSNSITIDDQFYSSRIVETLRMNDGTGDVDLTTMSFTTYGSSGSDLMDGLLGNGGPDDIMYGLGGDDDLEGKGGNDTLYGGDGNDDVDGDAGDDVLDGGTGDDILRGDDGNDLFIYSSGMDTIFDSGDDDTVWITGGLTINDIVSIDDANTSDASIVISASVDEILVDNLRYGISSYHVESLRFDDGFETDQLPDYNNWFWGTASGETLSGDGNNNTLIGKAGNDTITGAGGADHAHGGDGDDDLDGGAGADTLYGGADDDTITGGTGDDVMDGGAGTDTVDYSGDGAAVTVNLITGTATDGNSDSDTLAGVENVIGSDYNDTITGDGSANDLQGGDGNDDIDGEGGNDTLTGGAGDDTLDGGTGTDRVTYAAEAAGVTVNLSTGSATDGNSDTDTLTGIEDVTGSGYADTITGDDNANDLIGLAGNDNLTGGAGNDTLNGGTGDDTLNGGDGSGDWVTYEDDAAAVNVNLGTGSTTDGNSDTDTLSNVENVTGSGYNDTITGDGNANTLVGGDGNDTISGAAGTDSLYGGEGNDTLNGGDDADTLYGGAGTDTLNGDAGDDVLYGGAGVDALNGGNDSDTLYGSSGGDTLHGDAGNDVLYGMDDLDTLYGDGGADTFMFLYQYAFNDVDVVKDFDISTDNDVLDLSDILANTDYEYGVDAITDWIEITTNGSDSDVKVDTTGTGTFGGGTQIATLEGITGLTDEAALVSSGNLIVV